MQCLMSSCSVSYSLLGLAITAIWPNFIRSSYCCNFALRNIFIHITSMLPVQNYEKMKYIKHQSYWSVGQCASLLLPTDKSVFIYLRKSFFTFRFRGLMKPCTCWLMQSKLPVFNPVCPLFSLQVRKRILDYTPCLAFFPCVQTFEAESRTTLLPVNVSFP